MSVSTLAGPRDIGQTGKPQVDVSIRIHGLTICVGLSAQMSWLVLLLLGGSGFLDYSSTHVAVCRHRTRGPRALRGMEMSAA